MKIYWIFLIIAIICALCSDRIDRAVNANKKAKKIILILCGALFLGQIFGYHPKWREYI